MQNFTVNLSKKQSGILFSDQRERHKAKIQKKKGGKQQITGFPMKFMGESSCTPHKKAALKKLGD